MLCVIASPPLTVLSVITHRRPPSTSNKTPPKPARNTDRRQVYQPPATPERRQPGAGSSPVPNAADKESAWFRRDAEHGHKNVFHKYGATNPAEFFPVATECFFEKPIPLRRKHPQLYEELKAYYRQDPALFMFSCWLRSSGCRLAEEARNDQCSLHRNWGYPQCLPAMRMRRRLCEFLVSSEDHR